MRFSLRWKLTLAVGVPVACIAAATTWIGHVRLREVAFEQTRAQAEERAATLASTFDARLTALAQVARSSAAFLSAHPGLSEAQLYALAESNVRQNELIYGSCIAFVRDPRRGLLAPYVYRGEEALRLGARGLPLRRLDVKNAYDYTTWDWFDLPRQTGEALWTEPYEDKGAGEIFMCTFAAPFFHNGDFAGVATVDLPLEALQSFPGVRARLGQDGAFLILSRGGVIISSTDEGAIGRIRAQDFARSQGRPDLERLVRRMLAGENGTETIPAFGQSPGTGASVRGDVFFYFAPIPSTRWSFVAGIPEAEIMAPVFARLRERAAWAGIASLAAVGFAVLLGSWIIRPVSRLSEAVKRLAEGDLDARAQSVDARDEIGDLARAFNAMVGQLRAHIEALTRETAALEAVESELRVARSIQESLLPRVFPPFPDRAEFDLFAVNAPARHVAGDFFDFFFIDERRLVLVIADVSGKGAPAAVFMAVARTVLRDLARAAPSVDRGPGALLTDANRILLENNTFGMFVTVWLGIYDTATGELRYANAGHPSPYLITGGVVSAFGESTGPILGILEDIVYDERAEKLLPDTLLVFFTDGVHEARRRPTRMSILAGGAPAVPAGAGTRPLVPDADEFFGLPRLERLLAAVARSSGDPHSLVERLCARVVEDTDRFQANERVDDVTVMAFRRAL